MRTTSTVLGAFAKAALWGAVFGEDLACGLTPPSSLALSQASLTSKWFEGSDFVQIIEVVVNNTDPTNALTVADALHVTASSSSFDLVTAGTLKRLTPNQAARVQLGIRNKPGVKNGTSCSGVVSASWAGKTVSTPVSGLCGFGQYAGTAASVNSHQSPDWYDNAKFGIFIHWGLYSAPAYGSVAPHENYAEWYWNHMNHPNDPTDTYNYHKETYGIHFNYDDFMSNFTASKFNSKEWLDLFDAAGAKYFVPVTKHHDGFAIFDVPAKTSNRSSVKYGPKRDFLRELFTAAKKDYPHLRRGTYFSMPEWYNPAYAKYAMGADWFTGGPPKNPYTNATLEYTGYVPVNDYVQDLQYPQMQSLAYDYETEIMWCDIGGANNSPVFMSEWFNWATARGRQVVFNGRCGLAGDFDTPEYRTNAQTVARKWESNRGMDSFSFGYNYQTPNSSYLHGIDIVHSLVDIVSKNGNFLLDIGPKNDGSIPGIMVQGLRDAGAWIHAHAESIFDTAYWETTAGEGSYRYTTTKDAFYIHILSTPSSSTKLPDKVPFLKGDTVTVVGGRMHGKAVPVTQNSDGTITLNISQAVIAADDYAWTFKITY